MIKQKAQEEQAAIKEMSDGPILDEIDEGIIVSQNAPTYYMVDQVDSNRILAFHTMDSFAQHRIGIISSVILAVISKRMLILPKNIFCLTGQACSEQYAYDQEIFSNTLRETGIQFQIIDNDVDVQTYQKFQCTQASQVCFQQFISAHDTSRLFVNFPEVVSFPKDEIAKYKVLMKALFDGLVLSNEYQTAKSKIVRRIQLIGRSDKFNSIAIDKSWTEQDKISHVVVRVSNSSIEDSKVQIPYYAHVLLQMLTKQFEQDVPMYISRSDLEASNLYSLELLIQNLQREKYVFVTERPIFSDVDYSYEYILCLNYFINLEAERFLGDGTLLVNQLIVLERQLGGKQASFFNVEILPLWDIYPVFTVPWVFAYNAQNPSKDYLVKAVVRSAIKVGKVTPYCLFLGLKNNTMARWLEAVGVTLIHQKPLWMSQLVIQNTLAISNTGEHGNLFDTPEALVTNFLRIDIPVLSQLSQYAFVLYTDTDVYFRKKVDLTELPVPLPETVGMGFQVSPSFPYSAGISVMNMFGLRTNYDVLLQFILQNKELLNFQEYGTAVQGAFNQFYESSVKRWVLPQAYNGKPYQDFNEDAVIVHFEGPKPHDYHQYLSTNNCSKPMLQDLCQQGAEKGMCQYILEWAQFATQDPISQEFVSLCKTKMQGK
eukprot:TRINITY_DN1703_c2_g1_i1.p1 TRINITY_DN1703_c2_g1~~TRINITY_DN1703_c2_g1_i1.p1  ORF type:complete len:656 (-),score=37.40 TRINITY_DN1703_c2_g1_i1:1651-3618(-)